MHLYAAHGATPRATLIGIPDLSISAVAVSRDGALVAAFGTLPSYTVEQWDVSSGAALRGSTSVVAPGLVSSASYCPSDRAVLCGSGPAGLFFFRSAPSFDFTETTVVTADAPAGPILSAVAVGEAPSTAAQAVLTAAAEAYAVDAASAHLALPAGQAAVAAAAGRGGANAWLCHAWIDADTVAGATADGNIHAVSCTTGARSVSVSTEALLGAAEGSAARVLAYGMVLCGSGLLLACSDGVLRLVAPPRAGERAFTLVCSLPFGPIGERSALLSLAVPPSFSHAVVCSANGAVLRVPLPLRDEAKCVARLPGRPVLAAALLVGASSGVGTRRAGPLVTVEADGSVSLWSSPGAGGMAPAEAALTNDRALLGHVSLPPTAEGGMPPMLTSLAAHPRLPLVAVGTSCGRVALLTAQTAGAGLAVQYVDSPHAGSITALAFSRTPGSSLLASLSAAEGTVALHGLQGASAPVAGGNALLAFAHVPASEGRATCLAWADSLLLVATAEGSLLSLPSVAVKAGPVAVPADASSALLMHGRFAGAVLSLDAVASAASTAIIAAVGPSATDAGGVRTLPLAALPSARASAAVRAGFDLSSCSARLAVPALGNATIVAVAASPVGTPASCLLAAGGSDGSVAVLTVTSIAGDRPVVTSAGASVLHVGSVAAGRAGLSWAPNGRALLSVGGADGALLTAVPEGEAAAKAEAAAAGSVAALVKPAAEEEALYAALLALPAASVWPSQGMLARAAAAAEAASAAEHIATRESLLAEVSSFRAQLASLLTANEAAPTVERLPRLEFVLDEQGRVAVEAEFDAAVAVRQQAYADEIATLDAAIKRVQAACVEGMESLDAECAGIHSDIAVRNFALPKRAPVDAAAMLAFATERSAELAAGGGVDAAVASLIPSDADWLMGAGALSATVNPAAQLEKLLADKAANAEKAGGGGGGGGKAPGEAPEEGASSSGGKAGGEEGAAESGEVAWEGEAVCRLLFAPTAVRSPGQRRAQVAFLRELIRASQASFNAAFKKLADEKAELVETVSARHVRLRSVLETLGLPVLHVRAADAMARRMAGATGGLVEAAPLVAAGLTAEGAPLPVPSPYVPAAITAVAEASAAASAAAIAAAPTSLPSASLAGLVTTSTLPLIPLPPLGRGRTAVGPQLVEASGPTGGVLLLADPLLSPSERPHKAIKLGPAPVAGGVPDPQVMLAPFLTAAEARRRAEEEARTAAAASNKDDAPDRALIDMFDGQLAGKDELLALSATIAQHVARCPFLHPGAGDEYVPSDSPDLTSDQVAEWAIYKREVAALEEEKARQRNSLLAELTKVTTEARDTVAAFDERLAAMAKFRTGTGLCVAALELLAARLERSVAAREGAVARDAGLEALFNARLAEEERAAVEHEGFLAPEAATASALDAAKEGDRAVERSLRGELVAANGGAPLDSDLWKVLTTLFKKRAPPPPAAPAAPMAPETPVGSDPWAWSDVTGPTPTHRAAAAHAAAIKPLLPSDCPEGYGSIAENAALWEAINRCRIAKIGAELKVAEAGKRLEDAHARRARLAAEYTRHKDALDAWAAAREALALQVQADAADTALLVRIKAGQDETTHLRPDGTPHPLGGDVDAAAVMADALLLPVEVVDGANAVVTGLGSESVAALQAIRDFRCVSTHTHTHTHLLARAPLTSPDPAVSPFPAGRACCCSAGSTATPSPPRATLLTRCATCRS